MAIDDLECYNLLKKSGTILTDELKNKIDNMSSDEINMPINKNGISRSLVYFAIIQGNLDTIKYLYDHGAKFTTLTLKSSIVDTLLFSVVTTKKIDILKYILSKLPDNTIKNIKINSNEYISVKYLIEIINAGNQIDESTLLGMYLKIKPKLKRELCEKCNSILNNSYSEG